MGIVTLEIGRIRQVSMDSNLYWVQSSIIECRHEIVFINDRVTDDTQWKTMIWQVTKTGRKLKQI